MAGMLPGVESARRRRFHHGGSSDTPAGTRRSSFCLYTTSHETQLSVRSMRTAANKGLHGGALGDIAREAKERLDERLRTKQASEMIKRDSSSNGSVRPAKSGGGCDKVQGAVFSMKKSFSWSRLGWKATEQAECAVCLEEFKTGEMLVHLPCAHRFHWNCVVPWLEGSSQCPCCRTAIFS